MNYKHTHRNKDTDKKTTLSAVNAGSQDTEYLYYPLYVESVTLKGSLLQAHINKIKQTIIIIAT